MIELIDVTWDTGTFALEDIRFAVPRNCYSVLMGATGSGKTTIIEIIAGLRQPQAGRVMLDGKEITRAAPGRRGVGYVPQDGALFPTMKVRDQLGFALKIRRWKPEPVASRVQSMAEDLGIAHLLDRFPRGLSGGERQRVALGRALLSDPKVLLLDEPLSALDESTRDDMTALLKRIQRESGVTALHITHSRSEALVLADQLLSLEGAKVREVDPQTLDLPRDE